MLGTLKRFKNDEPSLVDLPADLLFLVLSYCYPEWYHYRLRRDILFISDAISQVGKKTTEATVLDTPTSTCLTLQFSQMRLSPSPEQHEKAICEDSMSCSEKSANKIS